MLEVMKTNPKFIFVGKASLFYGVSKDGVYTRNVVARIKIAPIRLISPIAKQIYRNKCRWLQWKQRERANRL